MEKRFCRRLMFGGENSVQLVEMIICRLTLNYGGTKMKDITSTITKPLAVLGENGKGYTKEANFISWNGNAAKLDIREWHPNHERCGKGITLTEDEGRNLYDALKAIYEKE